MLVGAVLSACLLLFVLGLIALWVNRRSSSKGDDLAASLNKCSTTSESNTLNLAQPANNSYNSAKLSLPETLPGNRSPAVSDLKLELSGNNNNSMGDHPQHSLHGHHSLHHPQQIRWEHDSLLLSNNNNLLNANHLHPVYGPTTTSTSTTGTHPSLNGHSQLDSHTESLHSVYANRYQLLGVTNVPSNHSAPSYVESIYNYPSSAAFVGPNSDLHHSNQTSPSHPSNSYLLSDSQAIVYGLNPAITSNSVYLPPGYADYAQLIEYGSLQTSNSNNTTTVPVSLTPPTSNYAPNVIATSNTYDSNGFSSSNNFTTGRPPFVTSTTVATTSGTNSGKALHSQSPSRHHTNVSPPMNPTTTNASGTSPVNVATNANYRNYITSNGNLQCVVNTSALATHV